MAGTSGQTPNEEKRQARLAGRRERTREEILAAARTILLRDGIANVTLESVAREAGMSKTAIYYYFASKDALFFEMLFGIFSAHAENVRKAVAQAKDAREGIHALIECSVRDFAGRMDDFRLTFMHVQLAEPGSVQLTAEQFARYKPVNDALYAGLAEKLATASTVNKAGVPPRLLAFLAHVSVIGLLTLKGAADATNDPLLYSDELLVNALSSIFAAAAETSAVKP